jgi:hypothetical protein
MDVSEENVVSELTATELVTGERWVDKSKWFYAAGRLQESWPIRTADRRGNETFAEPIGQVLKHKIRKQGHYTVPTLVLKQREIWSSVWHLEKL